MKGIVFTEFLEMVESKFSPELADPSSIVPNFLPEVHTQLLELTITVK